ncbi:alpha/beta hydrolase family esterase [Streptomyces sp. NPDC049936]|uniref:alpha/beta hydrolase family esterase n=1 Tax=Streptomyces sp. NPDC049936 TaxID=3365599 RepID=UPI003794630B
MGMSHPGPSVEHRKVDVAGQQRTYVLVRPERDPGPDGRILLALHGSNSSGRRFRVLAGREFDRWAVEGTGLVIYPDSWRGSLWNDARASTPSKARAAGIDDVAFLRTLIDMYGGVRSRTYGVGYSNGGQMIIRALLSGHTSLFGAAALLSATVAVREELLAGSEADAPAPVPLLMAHGTRDPLVPYEGGTASLFGFRPRGRMRSAEASARFWAARNGVEGIPRVTDVAPGAPSRTPTSLHRFERADRPPVHFYSTLNGGHVVPNPVTRAPRILGRTATDVDLPAVVLDFFEQATTDASSDSETEDRGE